MRSVMTLQRVQSAPTYFQRRGGLTLKNQIPIKKPQPRLRFLISSIPKIVEVALGGKDEKPLSIDALSVIALVQPNHIVHLYSGDSLACRRRASSIILGITLQKTDPLIGFLERISKWKIRLFSHLRRGQLS